MNMHGFIAPQTSSTAAPAPLGSRLRAFAWAHRMFLLIVVLPTLLTAGYLFLFAADQYKSEAHFVIRSAESMGGAGSGFGQLLGISGPLSQSQSDAMGVSEYMKSQEAVNALRAGNALVERFQRPEADALSRLRSDNPTPERLLKYYRSMVSINYNRDTGISTLEVRGFRPDDAYSIINALLHLGEQRVNQLNQRTYTDAVSSARLQLAEAETAARQLQQQLTAFRQTNADINPTSTGEAQTTLVTTLSGELSAARAQLAVMSRMISPDSPQYRAMQARVSSLEREVAAQSGRLAGGGSTIASRLGGFEDLKVRQEFVAKRYEAAASNLEKARDQVRRQHLYLTRIVQPNMPVKSTYPERFRVTFTLLLGLLVAYGIGWLIVAGVREHQA